MHTFFFTLREKEYIQVSMYNNTKERWERLEELYGEEKELEEEDWESECSTNDKEIRKNESSKIQSSNQEWNVNSSHCDIFTYSFKELENAFRNYLVDAKLEGWKSKLYSQGGWVILLKKMRSSLPIFSMSLFKVPWSTRDKLDHIQRHFLWTGNNQNSGVHYVKWDKVCNYKE